MTHRQPISDVVLEQYRLGELPVGDRGALDARIARDADLAARLSALEQSDTEIRERYPSTRLAGAVQQRVDGARPTLHRGAIWKAVALASAAVLAVATGVGVFRAARPPSADGIRVKGDATTLVIYRKTLDAAEQMKDGDAVHRGDLIRVAYRSVGTRYGIIVSIDGRHAVTRHLPTSGESAVALATGDTTPLDHAYELDDAPRWERFYLITGDAPFSVTSVIDAATRAAAASGNDPPATLPLPANLEQSTFLIRKISEESSHP
jgi:hypothetical protein